ncbi:MAG: ZIP family metal transporter [Actinomycetes bacterium]
MNIAIFFAALTVGATTLGGYVALRSKDRFHLLLGLSAGLLLGLVGFDLLPEVFKDNHQVVGSVRAVSIAIVGGFLLLHILERLFGSHEPAESDYGHDHEHHNIAGTLGAIAMGGHVFLDGIGLGVAFRVSNALGIAVFLAIVVHAFSDGLNTVSLLIKSGQWSERAKLLLVVDAAARLSGAAIGSYLALNSSWLSLYLALFSGFVIYLATSHILPEAHSRHPSKWTLAATALGVGIMWLVVAFSA